MRAQISVAKFIWAALAFFTIMAQLSPAESNYDAAIIKNILAEYDWRMRPMGTNPTKRNGGPLLVYVNMLLRTISKIDDVNMEFSTQFTFRQSWNDQRLAYGNIEHSDDGFLANTADKRLPQFVILAPGDHTQHIWLPDSFFQNEKHAQKHMVDKPNILIRIYSNGDVLYSVRLSLVLSCPMSLVRYPMDDQHCYIDFSSYAYTVEDIIYFWSNNTPIQLKDTVNTSLPSFELARVSTTTCVSSTSTGEYSCLRVHLKFKRMFSYYLIQLYIPSFMLVIVSWVSFWVDKSSVPARVTLGVTTLLTITTQASGINAKLPPVSYTKAIDVWIGVCLAFVFGALLEYALVNYADDDSKRTLAFRKRSSKSTGPQETAPLCCAGCGQGQILAQPNRPCFPVNFGYDPTSPLLGRSNTSYRWGDEEEGKRASLFSASDYQNHHCFAENGNQPILCPNCSPAASGPRFPSRRSTVVSTRSKSSQAPSQKKLGRWADSLYYGADRAKKIDVISRFLFPFFFLLFNCVYWTVY